MKAKKVIPTPVDVVGRNVSWKTDSGHTLYGEVIKVGFRDSNHILNILTPQLRQT